MLLSTRGLSNIPRLAERNDFEFVVGNKHDGCPSLIADFLSPHIAHLHRTDPSISAFIINMKDDHENFVQFLNVGFGVPLAVNESNSDLLRSICDDVGNKELEMIIIKETSKSVLERVCGLGCLGLEFVSEEDLCEVASTFWQSQFQNLLD
jgi:hypothetical protein